MLCVLWKTVNQCFCFYYIFRTQIAILHNYGCHKRVNVLKIHITIKTQNVDFFLFLFLPPSLFDPYLAPFLLFCLHSLSHFFLLCSIFLHVFTISHCPCISQLLFNQGRKVLFSHIFGFSIILTSLRSPPLFLGNIWFSPLCLSAVWSSSLFQNSWFSALPPTSYLLRLLSIGHVFFHLLPRKWVVCHYFKQGWKNLECLVPDWVPLQHSLSKPLVWIQHFAAVVTKKLQWAGDLGEEKLKEGSLRVFKENESSAKPCLKELFQNPVLTRVGGLWSHSSPRLY